MFQAIVVSIVLSGLGCFDLSKTDLHRLDTFIASKGRSLMRGKACIKTQKTGCSRRGYSAETPPPRAGDFCSHYKHKACTNLEVFKWMGYAGSATEPVVVRLKWYQNMVKFPSDHDQVLTAVFAKFAFEKDHNLQHPWLLQSNNDLELLRSIDSDEVD